MQFPTVASSLWTSVSPSVKWGEYLPSRAENKSKVGAQPSAQSEVSNPWMCLS